MSQSIRRAVYRAKGLPDPGPTPTHMYREFSLVVEKPLGDTIDTLYELVQRHFESRNDFLIELLKEGVTVAHTAALDAAREQQAREPGGEKADTKVVGGLDITNPDIPAGERDAISSRLRMLRGEDLREAAGAIVNERAS